eukprot:CAMPEP_0117529822 /NCGR_PEP_ID=MMETSP0784-20121206/38029_1 /TAXON_ID=39447 /ORGANISM="" /LENGTH=310 /DNA_ID=CAMNT_0005326153 /DNA_START=38 /DNA_END=970 /DNA_ORIENTATION=+
MGPIAAAPAWISSGMLLSAAVVAWRRLRTRMAVTLMLGATLSITVNPALTVFRRSIPTVLETLKALIAQQTSEMLVRIVVQLTEDGRNVNRLLQAFSSAIRMAVANEEFKDALKQAVVEAMRFDMLHNEIVQTLTGSMIAASKDKSLRGALLTVITEALKDEGFMSEMLATMTHATIAAAQNRDLRDSILNVAKSAITDAIKDKGFVADVTSTITNAGISAAHDEEIRDAMVSITKIAIVDALKDESFLTVLRETLANSLKDGRIYRGAAAGVFGAFNPFGRGGSFRQEELNGEVEENEKSDPSSSAGGD